MITLNEFKLSLGINLLDRAEGETKESPSEKDLFLQSCIDGGIGRAEVICNQELLYGLRKKFVPYLNPTELYLKNYYIVKVTKLQYVDRNGGGLTDIVPADEDGISESILVVNKDNGKLYLCNGSYFPCVRGSSDSIFRIPELSSVNFAYSSTNREVPIYAEYYSGFTTDNCPAHLKYMVTLLATWIYNNSGAKLSRFGLTSRNMNAAGSSGQSFVTEDSFYNYASKELMEYTLQNI